MATMVQRLDQILTGLLDVIPTVGQTLKVADGYTSGVSDAAILAQFGTTRALLTNGQKAAIAVIGIRAHTLSEIRNNTRQNSIFNAAAAAESAADTAIGGL